MIKLNSFYVVDLEATAWVGDPPEGQKSEIIEIGIVKVNLETYEITRGPEILVKPRQSIVSEFCEDLTSLTQKDLDSNGMDFLDACELLKTFACNKPWGSWGGYDQRMLDNQCFDYNIKNPLGKYTNLKFLFSLLHGFKKEYGLVKAMTKLELTLQGKHHRGIDDAFNTARLFIEILKRYDKNDYLKG